MDERIRKGTTEVTIHPSVTVIHEEAFKDCTSLSSVTIPSTIKEIEKGAFDNCKSIVFELREMSPETRM